MTVNSLHSKCYSIDKINTLHPCAKTLLAVRAESSRSFQQACELMFCSTNNDGVRLSLFVVAFTAATKVYCSWFFFFLENKVNRVCSSGPRLLPRLQMTALPWRWQTRSSKQLKSSRGWFLLVLWEQAVHFNEHGKQNPDWWLCFKLLLP